MKAAARFHYPLTPVLLTRQWALDALLTDLNRLNASIAALRQEIAALQKRTADTANEWNRRTGMSVELSTSSFLTMTDYLRDMARQRAAKQTSLETLEQKAQELIEKVAAARKAVETVEQHRDRMHAHFRRVRAGMECKLADDQWSVLRLRKMEHDY